MQNITAKSSKDTRIPLDFTALFIKLKRFKPTIRKMGEEIAKNERATLLRAVSVTAFFAQILDLPTGVFMSGEQ